MLSRLTRDRIVLITFLFWTVLICGAYYIQFWRLIHGDPNAYFSAFRGSWEWHLRTTLQAGSRAVRALSSAAIILADAYILGLAITRLLKWRFRNWREAILFQLSIGLGTISYFSILLAIAGLYQVNTIRVLLASVLVVGLGWLAWSVVTKRPAEPMPFPRLRWPAAWTVSDGLWQIISFLAVGIALIGALAPETEWDALWYHLWLPKLWLAAGHPVDVISEMNSLYPLTWELIFGAGLAMGGPVPAKLLHFATLPLTAVVVFEFARRFFPRASAWLAVAAFLTVPTTIWESTTALVDLALALHTALALFALFRYAERQQGQWLALSALNFGLGAATKYLGLIIGALAAIGLLFYLWSRLRQGFWRAARPAVILGLTCLLVPLPWFVRSWRASGNPVFPLAFRVFGAKPPERWDDSSEKAYQAFLAHYGKSRTLPHLAALPWDTTVHPAHYAGSLGPIFLVFLPALFLFRGQRNAASWLFAFSAAYLAVWASPLSSFQMRFVIAITPVLALLVAEAYGRIESAVLATTRVSGAFALSGVVAVLLILNLPPFTALHETDQPEHWLSALLFEIPVGVVSGAETQRAYLSRRVTTYNVWEYINSVLPDSSLILSLSAGDNFYRDRKFLSDSALTWKAAHGQESEAIQALRDMGITHVLFDRYMVTGATTPIATPSFIQRWFTLEYQDKNCILYRFHRSGNPPLIQSPAAGTSSSR
jgi:4-amino-4-deoxy-L-arabinose transferase-like glycosyltransferase